MYISDFDLFVVTDCQGYDMDRCDIIKIDDWMDGYIDR